jgi:hypothetical protein
MSITLFTVLLPSFLELDLCELGEYTEGPAKRIARDMRQEQEAGAGAGGKSRRQEQEGAGSPKCFGFPAYCVLRAWLLRF